MMRHKSKKKEKKNNIYSLGVKFIRVEILNTILHYTHCVHPKLIPPLSHLLLYLIYASHFTLLQSNDFHNIRVEIKGFVKEIEKKRLK